MTRAEMLFEILKREHKQDKIFTTMLKSCPCFFDIPGQCKAAGYYCDNATCFECWLEEVNV